MCGEFKIIKEGTVTEYTVEFQVDDESVLFYTPTGDLTERLDQVFSGWSFQDDSANDEFAEFLEEINALDLVEWTEDMELGETVEVCEGLGIVREG